MAILFKNSNANTNLVVPNDLTNYYTKSETSSSVELKSELSTYVKSEQLNGFTIAVTDQHTAYKNVDGQWNGPTDCESLSNMISFHVNKMFVLDDGKFCIFTYEHGSYSRYTSNDGLNWTEENNVPSYIIYSSYAYGNGVFVGLAHAGTDCDFMYSSDSRQWNIATTQTLKPYSGIIRFSDGKFTHCSHSTLFVSEDGMNWTEHAIPSEFLPCSGTAIYANGTYVIANSESSDGSVLTTTDFINWTKTVLIGYSAIFENTRIAYGNGILIIGSLMPSTQYYLTTNCVDWQLYSHPYGGINRVDFVGGKFYSQTIIPELTIVSSTNGISWTFEFQDENVSHMLLGTKSSSLNTYSLVGTPGKIELQCSDGTKTSAAIPQIKLRTWSGV